MREGKKEREEQTTSTLNYGEETEDWWTEVDRGWALRVSVKEGTCVHQDMIHHHVRDESLHSSPETSSMLNINRLEFKYKFEEMGGY